MQNVMLGSTGVKVSRLAFGTVFMGERGDCLPAEKGAALLLHALERGVAFWDTSDDYDSHRHVACALRQVERAQVVIASKSCESAGAIERILAELETDYLDILLMHDVSHREIEAAGEGLRLWQPGKARGRVRALGLSTHSVEVARQAAGWPETDVLMLPLNATGVCLPDTHIEDGSVAEMLAAARLAWESGKGVVAMKVLGCGTLASDPAAAIAFADRLPYVHSLCIGMRSVREIDEDARLVMATHHHRAAD
jgi:aryl-alcohol dehydrogenase-like predicted oxidoreductase